MKKLVWLVVFACLLSVSGLKLWAEDVMPASGMDENTGTEQAASEEAVKKFYCPMHPEVEQDKPGQCPKCGMDLLEKADETATATDTSSATETASEVAQQY